MSSRIKHVIPIRANGRGVLAVELHEAVKSDLKMYVAAVQTAQQQLQNAIAIAGHTLGLDLSHYQLDVENWCFIPIPTPATTNEEPS